MGRVRMILGPLLALGLMISLWQWWHAARSRDHFVAKAATLAVYSLDSTADRLAEWAQDPSASKMVEVRENWMHVQAIHNTLFRPDKMSPPWHQTIIFDSFIEMFADPDQPVDEIGLCLAERYSSHLKEWSSRADQLRLDPAPTSWSEYVDWYRTFTTTLAFRECPVR